MAGFGLFLLMVAAALAVWGGALMAIGLLFDIG